MARGDREWADLNAALRWANPRCADDIRFVLDNPSEGDLTAMAEACAACPMRLRTACDTYAQATRPPGTYWAGKHYPAGKDEQ